MPANTFVCAFKSKVNGAIIAPCAAVFSDRQQGAYFDIVVLIMRAVRIFALGIVTSALALALACAAAEPAFVVVEGARGGHKTVTVATGATLAVDLAGIPGTGYRWLVAGSPPAFLNMQSEDADGPGERPGQKVRQRLTFAVTGAGEGRLVLQYRRSWEPVTGKEETFELRVIAQ